MRARTSFFRINDAVMSYKYNSLMMLA